MFVVKYRDDGAVLLEGRGDLLKESPAGIQLLQFLVLWIIALFADAEDPVDGKRSAAPQ